MPKSLNNQVKSATRWSAVTEIAAKLVAPITSMVLARLLTPEAFGVVTTLAMIISFTEIFTDTAQVWEPTNSTKRLPDGTLVSPPLEDLAPFLPREELEKQMFIPMVDEG